MKPSKDKIAMVLAQALFESEDRGTIREKHLSALQELATLVESVPKFKSFLTSPMFSDEEKDSILSTLSLPKSIQLFLNLVMKHHMVGYFDKITNYYENLFFISVGKLKTKMTVARPSDIENSTKKVLIKKLEALTGKKVELECQVDPDLLGGFLLETTDLYLDTSLKKALEDLKNSI